MILNYQTFYRKFGVRQLPHLLNPTLSDIRFLDLPMESVYQFVSYDSSVVGPASTDTLFKNIKRPIPVSTVMKLTSMDGHPRPMGGSFNAIVLDYYRHNRRMRQLKILSSYARDKQTVIVYNYALLSRMYRYPQSILSHYYQWKNIFATVMNSITQISSEINHQHYLITTVPKVLPSVQQLVNATTEINQTSLKPFKDPESLILLHLWMWLAGNRSESLFNLIPKNKIHLVNLVFEESGQWTVLNLGTLNSFLEVKEDASNPVSEEEDYVIQSRHGIMGLQLAKRLLRFYMRLMEIRTIPSNVEVTEEESAPTHDSDTPVAGAEVSENDPDVESEGADDDEPDVSTQTHPIVDPGYDDSYKEKVSDAIYVNAALPDLQIEVDDLTHDEFKKLIADEDIQIDADLKQLEDIAAKADATEEQHGELHALLKPTPAAPAEKAIIDLCDKLAKDGLISAAEHRRFEKQANTYKAIKAPDGITNLPEFMKISEEMLTIDKPTKLPDSPGIIDKTMLHTTLNEFDSRYIKHVLHRDYANTVMGVQKAGIAVTSYKVERKHDILGGFEEHTLRLSPVEGVPSTVRFKVPTVSEEGNFMANGVQYRLRKQKGDVPIRKTAPNRVALTSYYGKTFLTRGRRNTDNYGHWLKNQLIAKALDKSDTDITDPVIEDAFDPSYKAPRSYTAAAAAMTSCKSNGYDICFDHKEVAKTYPNDLLAAMTKQHLIPFGKSTDGKAYLVMDHDGGCYRIASAGKLAPLGTLENVLNIDGTNAPVEYITAGIFGKDIPLGVILGILMGLDSLLKTLGVHYRRVPVGQRVGVSPDEYAIAFSDETLVFRRQDKLASLILGGFNEYARALKLFSVYSFDKSGVYVNLLESNKISTRYVRELELASKMFIDPITRDILIAMKEPTTYVGLLLKATQMLTTDDNPGELNPAYMRIKGYERLAGAVYAELVQAIRVHNSSLNKSNSSVQVNPYAVWKRISEDPSKVQSSQINPISSLKESEAVTFGGTGGRSGVSMTKDTRGFHQNDMGTISEATKDSGDVGIDVYTSANPKLNSLRGMTGRFDMEHIDPTSMLSTSALLAPCSDRDDPKRVNFVSIQQEHAIACDGYRQAIVRTGYDSIIPHRTTDLYAFTAKKPGRVRKVLDTGIIVDYDDGETQGFTIGRRFGNAQGLTVAHTVVTPLKNNDTFAVGDPIVYNTGFFEPDFFDPKKIVWKNSINARTVLWESPQTHEDSSAISTYIADKLTTKTTKIKTIVVNFDQAISNLVKRGDLVDADSVLCIIEDAVSANSKLFDERSIETLRVIGAQTPRAHVKGVVERVEVYYHGDKDDMSESLKAISDASDKSFRLRANSAAKTSATGSVDGGFRIDNNQLALDSLAIKVYISSNVMAGVGD